MTNYMATGMGGQPQPQPRPSPQGQSSPSMNMNVSPEKRNALKNYLEGYKDAIQKKTMDQLLPNISAPQMPMQQPMQQPMMMNMGGAVDVFEPQYMRNGGVTVGGSFTNEDLKQAKEIVDSVKQLPDIVQRDDAMKNIEDMTVGYSPTALTAARGMMGDYDPDFGEEMGSLGYNPQGGLTGKEFADRYSRDLTLRSGGFDEEIPASFTPSLTPSLENINLTNVTESRNPKQGTFEDLRTEIDDMNAFERGVGSLAAKVMGLGVDDQGVITPAGLLELRNRTQATLSPYSMQSRLARDRQLDRERAERKLAEEQRMRAMIQSMLPPAVETVDPTETTAPIADVITPTEPTSPVVESTRVPNFTIPALPTLPATSPLLPPGISPELLRNLFKLQGVPATAMQEGGSVNKLDTAVDNFLSAVRQ